MSILEETVKSDASHYPSVDLIHEEKSVPKAAKETVGGGAMSIKDAVAGAGKRLPVKEYTEKEIEEYKNKNVQKSEETIEKTAVLIKGNGQWELNKGTVPISNEKSYKDGIKGYIKSAIAENDPMLVGKLHIAANAPHHAPVNVTSVPPLKLSNGENIHFTTDTYGHGISDKYANSFDHWNATKHPTSGLEHKGSFCNIAVHKENPAAIEPRGYSANGLHEGRATVTQHRGKDTSTEDHTGDYEGGSPFAKKGLSKNEITQALKHLSNHYNSLSSQSTAATTAPVNKSEISLIEKLIKCKDALEAIKENLNKSSDNSVGDYSFRHEKDNDGNQGN